MDTEEPAQPIVNTETGEIADATPFSEKEMVGSSHARLPHEARQNIADEWSEATAIQPLE